MKKYIIIITFMLFVLSSCNIFIKSDINKDLDNPIYVPITAQTPAVQIALVDMTGGDFSRFNAMLVQQVEGVKRHWLSFNQYTGLTPNIYNDAWQNTYENILNELKIMYTNAAENNYNHYAAIINIMTAFTLLQATDVWGDIPYSEALQGEKNINPAYDTQEFIYATALQQLNNAINLIKGPPGKIIPSNEDVFYGGEMNAWLLSAHAIKARAFLHQEKYDSALKETKLSFIREDDNMAFMYVSGSPAPWFRFNRDREGDIKLSNTIDSLVMRPLNDTIRLATINLPFHAGSHPYLTETFNQELITYREIKFIEAETLLKTNGSPDAIHTAYLEGIKASFNHLKLAIDFVFKNRYYFPDIINEPTDSTLIDVDFSYTTYINQPLIDPGVGNITLKHILTQKYIGLFLQPEVYNDWRRTDIPQLFPISGNKIPVRWHYSEDEYLFNNNSPKKENVSIYNNKVGWDN